MSGEPTTWGIAVVLYEWNVDHLVAMRDSLPDGETKWLPDSMRINSLVLHILAHKDTDVLDYIIFAKQCEPFVQDHDWRAIDRQPVIMERMIGLGLAKYNQCQSSFLKRRYAFQVVRLAHYAGNFAQALSLYDTVVPGLPEESSIFYRTLMLKAGAHKRLGQMPEALQACARVFAEWPDLGKLAYRNFTGYSEAEFLRAAETADSEELIYILWQLHAHRTWDPSLDLMHWLGKHEPHAKHTGILLMNLLKLFDKTVFEPMVSSEKELDLQRSIRPDRRLPDNSAKRWAVSATDSNTEIPAQPEGIVAEFATSVRNIVQRIGIFFSKRNRSAMPTEYRPETWNPEANMWQGGDIASADWELIRDFKALALEVVRKAPEGELTGLWWMVAGYLAFLEGGADEALTFLQIATECPGNAPNLNHLTRLIRDLVRAMGCDRISLELEADLLIDLHWIESMEELHTSFEGSHRILSHLGRCYLADGQTVKAMLCFNRWDYYWVRDVLLDIYSQPVDLQALIALLMDPDLSEWEAYLVGGIPGPEWIQHLLGIRHMRRLEFRKADAVFAAMDAAYWPAQGSSSERYRFKVSFTDELPIGLNEPEEPPPTHPREEFLTHREFVQCILALEDNALSEPARAYTCYMRIAGALYRTPFWGYAQNIWAGDLVSSMQLEYSPTRFPFNIPGFFTELEERRLAFLSEYGSRKGAQAYYGRAMTAAQNLEDGAKACLMAAMCDIEKRQTALHRYETIPRDPHYATRLASVYRDTQICATLDVQALIHGFGVAGADHEQDSRAW